MAFLGLFAINARRDRSGTSKSSLKFQIFAVLPTEWKKRSCDQCSFCHEFSPRIDSKSATQWLPLTDRLLEIAENAPNGRQIAGGRQRQTHWDQFNRSTQAIGRQCSRPGSASACFGKPDSKARWAHSAGRQSWGISRTHLSPLSTLSHPRHRPPRPQPGCWAPPSSLRRTCLHT